MSESGFPIYISALLDSCWQKEGESYGFAYVQDLEFGSAAYAARYVMDKKNGELSENHYNYFDHTGKLVCSFEKEFALMSRRPGLGAGFVSLYFNELLNLDSVDVNGNEGTLPRYYDKLLERQFPDRVEVNRAKRIDGSVKHWSNNTRKRLEVRAKVHDAKMSFKKRSLK